MSDASFLRWVVGSRVVGMLDSVASFVWRVVIRAGHGVSCGEDGATRVPKRELISVLLMLLQARRLQDDTGLPLAEPLSRDLTAFRMATQAAGGDKGQVAATRERPVKPCALRHTPGPEPHTCRTSSLPTSKAQLLDHPWLVAYGRG